MIELVRAWLFPPACAGCDAPGPALCATCAPARDAALHFIVDGVPAFALGPYEGPLRRAIVAMKRGERDPLDAFAALLARAPVEGVLVPLATARRRASQRGFDQAVSLARRLGASRGIAVAEILEKHGRAQEGRGRRERLAAFGRFRLRPGVTVPPAVTLLDDVCTTGATLQDAAHTLRAAGARVRRIVVIARSGGTTAAPERS